MSSIESPPVGAPASMSQSPAKHFSFKNISIEEVLEDLSSRFILNLPEEELVSVERICFQVEQAHWYYEDYIRDEEPSLPSLTLKTFSRMLFRSCPLLVHLSIDHDQAFQDFMAYKTSVPVCGAIMINSSWTKCVLVKGWKSSAAWSFPRGKINLDEPEYECAVREVMEETGYDISDKIILDAVIRITVKDQHTSLFVVPNVPEDTVFETKTRKEISKIAWFNLADLPAWRKNTKSPTNFKFYAISSFVGPLKTLIKQLRATGVAKRFVPLDDQALSSHSHDLVSHSLPSDPAIISAMPHKSDDDHLSRLLGSLATPPALSSNAVPATGALPTPQATPSAAHAIKNDLKPIPSARQPTEEPVKSSFSSPTPPNSEKTDDPPDWDVRHQNVKPRPTFEFVSPFDALALPNPNRSVTNPSAIARNSDGTQQPISPTSTQTNSTSPHSPSVTRPGYAPALEHFAPPSIARAHARRFSNDRKTSVSSVVSLSPKETNGITVASPEPSSDRQAQHIALLQSLGAGSSMSSCPRPGPIPNHSCIEDSPFVVNPARAPTMLSSQLLGTRGQYPGPSQPHSHAVIPRPTGIPEPPVALHALAPNAHAQPSPGSVLNPRVRAGNNSLQQDRSLPTPGHPPLKSNNHADLKNDLLNLLNGPCPRPPMIQAGLPHNSPYNFLPERVEHKEAPLIHAPAPHHYNAMIPYSISGARSNPAVNPQLQAASIPASKSSVTQPPNAKLLAILNRATF